MKYFRLCLEHEVKNPVWFHSPINQKEICIMGYGATRIRDELDRAKVGTEFSDFEFSTKDSELLLVNQHHISSLKVEKFIGGGTISWTRTAGALCNLIVAGTEVGKANPQKPGMSLYAVAPAHLVLTEEQYHQAVDDEKPISIENLRKEVNSTSAENMYFLKFCATEEQEAISFDIQHPVMISYRHYYRKVAAPTESSGWLCAEGKCTEQNLRQCPHYTANDIALLRIERYSADMLCRRIANNVESFENCRFSQQRLWLTEKNCKAMVGKLFYIGQHRCEVIQYNGVDIHHDRTLGQLIWFIISDRKYVRTFNITSIRENSQ